MSARTERHIPAKRQKSEQSVVNFDVERLKAPFLLRCGAIAIDYILLICMPVIGLLLGRAFNYDGAKLLTSEISNVGWLALVLLALTNFVIFPLFTGKSLGKMLTGLRIVNNEGIPPSFSALLIRHLVGYPLTIISFGLGFVLAAFNQKGRALHDFLAGTVVVYGQRKIKNVVE